MNEGELKPCPCCGGKAKLAKVDMPGFEYMVYCVACHLQTDDSTPQTVTKVWNTR